MSVIEGISYADTTFQDVIALRHRVLGESLGLAMADQQYSRDAQSTHVGIRLDGALAAVGSGHMLDDASVFYISKMAVDESYRKQGLGKQLIGGLESAVQSNRATEIRLFSREDAVAFYEKLGYTNNGYSHDYHGIKTYRMNKVMETT